MNTFGYCRISTAQQNIGRQVENIVRAYPHAKLYQEAFTGTKVQGRREWERLMKQVKSGDTIVFDAVDRMSRNAEEGVECYMELYEKGVNLVFLKNPTINTDMYRKAASAAIPMTGTKVDGILAAINDFLRELASEQITAAFAQAQAEVDHLHQRTREGMAAAGATNRKDNNGNVIQGSISKAKSGKTVETKKGQQAKQLIKKHSKTFGGTLTDQEVIDLCKCSRNSYYKYKRAIYEDMIK